MRQYPSNVNVKQTKKKKNKTGMTGIKVKTLGPQYKDNELFLFGWFDPVPP